MGMDEILLYGGGLTAGIMVLAAFVFALIVRIRKVRLQIVLNKEYGERK